MKIKIAVFGCKVSQYEAQVLRERFVNAGDELVTNLSDADKLVVNTCVVTSRAESEGLRLAKQGAAKGKDVTITGCFARMDSRSRRDITGPIQVVPLEEILSRFPEPRESITYFAGHSRAFIKVEDGCSKRCHYCLVSRIRGPVRSRPINEVISEIQGLISNGYREIVFSGINLGLYGSDSGLSLTSLLQQVFALPNLPDGFRVRLSSLEPDLVSPDLIDLMANDQRIYPHFHLPLQSGSERILKKMGRGYTTAEYFSLVNRIRSKIPNLILTTDLMVGFPGETEEDFQATLDFAKSLRFMKAHIFRFSPRPGTPAASFPEQVPETIKKKRSTLLKHFLVCSTCHSERSEESIP
ncbi:MAG: MiaB/RimO family radical SAM methylthiotransferase [Candidatus Omnitrophota bacterium]